MSEQEKSGPDVATKAPVLMVEQELTMDSKHKLFRPTELQDEQPELHNKRSTAPAVPSVAAQLTIKPDDPVREDNSKSEWKEKEHESTEKLKHKPPLSKKSRSQASKQASKPEQLVETTLPATETIALTAVGVKDKPIPPIPTDVKPIPSTVSEPIKPVSQQDEDIITELRTPNSTRKISEWENSVNIVEHKEIQEMTEENQIGDYVEVLTSTHKLRKKEISWNEPQYLNKIHLQMPIEGQALKLERKASVGPCFRPGMPYEGPSGFKLYVPGKSNRHSVEDFKPVSSGISIKVSKKSLAAKAKSKINVIGDHNCNLSKKGQIEKISAPKTLRGKLDNICLK